MSDSNPNAEERERIVDAVVNKMLSKDMLPKEETDLDRFFGRLQEMIRAVNIRSFPIAEQLSMLPATDSMSLHNPEGRQKYRNQLMHFFLDEFTKFNRDELLFALAFVHAEVCVGERV